MKNKFLIMIVAILTMASFQRAIAAPTLFLECSEKGAGDFYAEVRLNQNQVATEIITARYLEGQEPVTPKIYSIESVFQKSNPPRFIGYRTSDFQFNFQRSQSGPGAKTYLFIQGHSRKMNAPCSVQTQSAFSQTIEASNNFNKLFLTSMSQGRTEQCCQLSCGLGKYFCKQVPEGQCIHHSCH